MQSFHAQPISDILPFIDACNLSGSKPLHQRASAILGDNPKYISCARDMEILEMSMNSMTVQSQKKPDNGEKLGIELSPQI